MSRYIDADALREKIDSMWNGRPLSSLGARILVTIDDAPSIDIVRCKECKHGTYCEEAEMYICSANDQDLYEAEHYCSYGERREP